MAKLERDGMIAGYWFIERNGNNSECYYRATEYKNGFAQVRKLKTSPIQWRDLLGRLTDSPTASGAIFNHFCEGIVALTDLEVIHFADKTFCQGIKDEIIRQLKEKLRHELIAGVPINKTLYQEIIDKSFRYVDNAHIEALKIIETRKEEYERRLAAQKEHQGCDETEKARQDAFDDTIDFLNNL